VLRHEWVYDTLLSDQRCGSLAMWDLSTVGVQPHHLPHCSSDGAASAVATAVGNFWYRTLSRWAIFSLWQRSLVETSSGRKRCDLLVQPSFLSHLARLEKGDETEDIQKSCSLSHSVEQLFSFVHLHTKCCPCFWSGWIFIKMKIHKRVKLASRSALSMGQWENVSWSTDAEAILKKFRKNRKAFN